MLVISRSVSGKNMADILALDADGCVVIVEIKRDWSDRATVGQLLEYAAAMTGKNYEVWKNWTETTGLGTTGQSVRLLDRMSFEH